MDEFAGGRFRLFGGFWRKRKGRCGEGGGFGSLKGKREEGRGGGWATDMGGLGYVFLNEAHDDIMSG